MTREQMEALLSLALAEIERLRKHPTRDHDVGQLVVQARIAAQLLRHRNKDLAVRLEHRCDKIAAQR